jgi:hypothetical protein
VASAKERGAPLAAAREEVVAGSARWLRMPLLAGAVAAAIWWLPKWPGVLEGRDRVFLVDPSCFELESGPDWLAGDVGGRLKESLAFLPATPLRDDAEVAGLLQAIRGASGWVRSVDAVAKRYPNQLEVEVTLREPVALVESVQGLVLLDAEAVVVALAADSSEYLADRELPLLHLERPLRVPTPGRIADDAQVVEGLRVAAELAPFQADLARRGLAVQVIDLTPKARSSGSSITDVELYTRSGLVLEWGRSGDHPEFGALEPTAEAKVRGLLRCAARYPELAGIRRVRLQFAEPSVLFDPTTPVAGGAPAGAP